MAENSNSAENELLKKIHEAVGEEIPKPQKSLRQMISDAQTLMYAQEANDIDRFCEISEHMLFPKLEE